MPAVESWLDILPTMLFTRTRTASVGALQVLNGLGEPLVVDARQMVEDPLVGIGQADNGRGGVDLSARTTRHWSTLVSWN